MAVSEQAPALDLEPAEEKKKVVTEDDFEERLAEIRKYCHLFESFLFNFVVIYSLHFLCHPHFFLFR